MNYGKFFRLNQRTSKIEDGVSIYDYIDLPAYFESSESNEMSPKYPISLTITENSVRFRVHYSAYRKEKHSPLDSDADYCYDIEQALQEGSKSSIRHMEEVILELPFTENSTDDLYNIIKDVYLTRYPILDRNENNNGVTNFIYQLIRKRYDDGYNIESPIEKQLYDNLRANCDSDSSYSALWLMGLIRDKKYNLFERTEVDSTNICEAKGFLRKLLLDFMFDLKHSDVFQTCKYYQVMSSSLLGNFYFSSLMHKCEYYYYRDLIDDFIKRKSVDEIRIIDHISKFYAKALIDAESLWIHDIMNPSAEKYFEHYYSDDILNPQSSNQWAKFLNKRIGWDKFSFRKWNSWFASPEEEMRRVYFTMKEEMDNKKYHICNAETLIGYLTIKKKELDRSQTLRTSSNKTEVSQWFLRRYAISDVLHLHSFKYASIPLYITILILLGNLFVVPNFVKQDFWEKYWYAPIIYLSFWGILIYLYYIWSKRWLAHGKDNENVLFGVRRIILKRRFFAIVLTIFLSILILSLVNRTANNCSAISDILCEVSQRGTLMKIAVIIVQVFAVIGVGRLFQHLIYPVHWLPNMHVFFPRLVASIAAAWLTLAAGEDLFVAFLDSIVSWSTSIWLGVIVFIFVMYEINKMLPLEETYVKVNRSLGIMAISYVISLIIGLCVINFMGERMLESGGELSNFYSNYVDTNTIKQVENKRYFLVREKNDNSPAINSSSSPEIMLNELQNVHVITEGSSTTERGYNHPIATSWELSGKTEGEKAEFFILREFLIQFSFIAMFIGIFIQMIFEEKGITEV